MEVTSEMGKRLISLLPYYLQNGQNIQKIFQVIGEGYDEIIDKAREIIDSRNIDKSFGFGLDILGDTVGQPRNGLDDETYRAILRTRIAENKSIGDIETLNDFGRMILGRYFLGILDSQNPAEIIFQYTYPLVKNPKGLMQKVAGAGINVTTELDTYVPICGTFTLGTTAFSKTIVKTGGN